MTVFEHYQGRVCINQDILLEMNLISNRQLAYLCVPSESGKLTRLRTKGRGRCGLIVWDTLPYHIQEAVKQTFHDPYKPNYEERFLQRIAPDPAAAEFFAKAGITPEAQQRRYNEAIILNTYAEVILIQKEKKMRNPGLSITETKRIMAEVIQAIKQPKQGRKHYPHDFKPGWKGLERKYKLYHNTDGTKNYASLIHGGVGNSSALKIKGENAKWILTYYAQPNKPDTHELWREYRKKAKAQGWPDLTENAIYLWLQKPAQKKKWILGRAGKDEFIKHYGHKLTRDRESLFPYAYLVIDGTKLDWVHLKEEASNKMGADTKVNLVFDVYSEKIVGWDLALTEDHSSHFRAWKMAIENIGVKPPVITYDNQSGHKSEVMQRLYDNIVASGGQHYPNRPKEHGSPAEQLIGRFQQEVLNKKYWSDKQSPTTRRNDSKPNIEFLQRFKHKLKDPASFNQAVAHCVNVWNEMPHPSLGCSRNEAANHEHDYQHEAVNIIDMMKLFWVISSKPSTYRRDGIEVTVAKRTYKFEVYDADGNVDIDFRDRYTGSKFFIQYDPDQLDNYVRLYLALPNGEKHGYVADAQIIKRVKATPALMDDHDQNRFRKMYKVRDLEFDRVERELEVMRQETGLTEEALIERQELDLKFRGSMPKREREQSESNTVTWLSKL